MNNCIIIKVLCTLLILVIVTSCDNRYDECMEYYIDIEDYYYEDAKDLCREEMDDYHV